MALEINFIQYNDTPHTGIECRYAECRNYLNVKLGVVMLNVKCRGATNTTSEKLTLNSTTATKRSSLLGTKTAVKQQ
jgi:hypothetical protein